MWSRLSVLLVLMLVCLSGSYAATVVVPVGNSIQAAINAANNGDVIQLNTGTYTEDLIILGGASNAKTNLTIEAAPGQSPVIEAANAAVPSPARGLLGILSLFIEAVAGYPATEPDDHGILIEGNGTTLRNLTIRNNSIEGDGQFGEAACVLVQANDVLIENCVIECASTTGAGRGIYVFTGNLPLFDQTVQALVGSKVFEPAGYTQPLTSSNLRVVNTTLRYGDAFFDTTDFVTYIVLLLSGETVYLPPVPPSGTFTNVEFDGGNLPSGNYDLAECDGGTYTFSNCFFHDHRGNFRISGGTQTFNDCKWQRALRDDHVEFNAAPEEGNSPIVGTFNNCIFCGGTDSGRLVKVNEGTGTFNACIFDITSTDANYRAIQYQPGDIDSSYYFEIPNLNPITYTACIVDNCDIYAPNSVGVAATDAPLSPEPAGNLMITDSIIYANQAVRLDTLSDVACNATVHHNNLFSTLAPAIANPGGWTVTENNNLNVNPGYANPGCDPAGFQYSNTTLLTAASDGGPVGSQGTPTSVGNWSLY